MKKKKLQNKEEKEKCVQNNTKFKKIEYKNKNYKLYLKKMIYTFFSK